MITLNCPSCGGLLELPDNLGVAHCMYCGTKILLEHTESTRDQLNLQRYTELCRVAFEAKNYIEANRYCNKILEIDPNNLDAWIDKALATIWLTTSENNRYEEALGYLNKAAQINPVDERITKTKEELTHFQARHYTILGNESYKNAVDIWKRFDDGTSNGRAQAIRYSTEKYYEAMNYYLLASSYDPESMGIRENIANLIRGTCRWIRWDKVIQNKTKTIKYLRSREQAKAHIP